MKLDYKKTLLLGFGFLASSLAWSLYNSLVPVLLEDRFALKSVIIGAIMTIDNVFGLVFQPLVGRLSDKTQTRFGRRMPWLLFGIPLSAIAFALIPWSQSLGQMMTCLIFFNLIMSLWRSPVIALMPDLTPSPLRSKANGLINLMGGIGSIIAFLVGGYLASRDPSGRTSFGLGSVIMIAALIMLLIFIREPQMPVSFDSEETSKGKSWLADLTGPEKKSLFFLLSAIFFWFCAYNAIETFFSLYAVNSLSVDKGQATMMLTAFSLTFVAFALPAGLIAGKVGRKKTILSGLFAVIVFLFPMVFIEKILAGIGSFLPRQLPVIVLLSLAGIGWSCVNINSLPMVVELASQQTIGTFTGYYYFFSFSASIVSPIAFGWIRDLTGSYHSLFVYALLCFCIALLCMSQVRHGEVSEV